MHALNLPNGLHTGQLTLYNSLWYWFFFIVVPCVPNVIVLSFVTQFLVLRALGSDKLYRKENLRALNLPNGLHTGQLTLYNYLWYWYFSLLPCFIDVDENRQ
jgi:hypothetical protein